MFYRDASCSGPAYLSGSFTVLVRTAVLVGTTVTIPTVSYPNSQVFRKDGSGACSLFAASMTLWGLAQFDLSELGFTEPFHVR